MSLALIQKPYEITLARNSVGFEVQTNNLFDEADVLPSLTLVFSDFAITGEGFIFEIIDPDTGNVIEFKFQAQPKPLDDGCSYLDESFPGTLQEYVEDNHGFFLLNGPLNNYFDVTYDGNVTITFTAKQAIVDLVPTSFSLIQKLDPVVPHVHVAGTISSVVFQKTRRKDYFVLLDVYFEDDKDSGNWRKVAELRDEPNSDGVAVFNIYSILEGEMKNSFDQIPIPNLGDFTVTKTDRIKRYFVAYAETYANKPTETQWISEKPMLVHCGGVSNEDFIKQDPIQYLQLEKKFVTWQTNAKRVKKTQNDWLTWLNYTNTGGNFDVKIKVYFKDGTDTGEVLISTVAMIPWEEILIPSGYVQRAVEGFVTSSPVYKWEISVTNQTGPVKVSEDFAFLLLESADKFDREVLYLNAFCAPETFLTRGEWTERLSVQKQVANRNLTHNYTLVNGQEFQFEQSSKTMYDARTGYMTQEEARALQDLLTQVDAFLLTEKIYYPILIDPESFEITKSLTFLNQLVMKVRRSFRVRNYSNAQQLPVITAALDCGIEGFKLDTKLFDVTAFGDLKLSLGSTVVHAAVAYSGPYGGWQLPSIEKLPGNYTVEVDITTAELGVINYNFNYDLSPAQGFIEMTEVGSVTFFVRLHTGETETLYVDWGISEALEVFPITDAVNAITKIFEHVGEKPVKFYMNCPEKMEGMAMISTGFNQFDWTAFDKIFTFVLSFETVPDGIIDVSPFKDLVTLDINSTTMDEIIVGFHENIATIDLATNQLTAGNIENLLLKLWDYRDFYAVAGISLTLVGNPGAGLNMTQISLDIINGTNAYVGEGLASDYGWTVTF